jgi:hypothetical protein
MRRLLLVVATLGTLFSAAAVASLGLLHSRGLPSEWEVADSPLPLGENLASGADSYAHAAVARR